jgi:hypothetical protein
MGDKDLNALVWEVEQLINGPPIRVARVKVEIHRERDPRAMNHMDAETKLIHARLEEWAQHVKRRSGAQGFPTESYYHKWALLKIAPQPGHEDEVIPDRVANVDGAVARLGVIDKSVICRFYLAWRPLGIERGITGIRNKHHFDKVLKRARWRVDGFLSAVERKDL